MRKVVCILALFCVLPLGARKTWTEKQAWAWEKRTGVIKGFNSPTPPYPGMTEEDVMRKAAELGYNSLRWWYGGSAEEAIGNITKACRIAEKYGMTVSPVVCVPQPKAFWESKGTDEAALHEMKEYTQKVIGALAKEKQIVLWDLWNEPGCGSNFAAAGDDYFLGCCRGVELMVQWAQEMNPTQPLTSSIFWRPDIINPSSPLYETAARVEKMMDVHNFHSYQCAGNSDDQGKEVQSVIDYLRTLGNRPIVCTECLTHLNNSGLSRTFAVFARNNIHFYQWGFYSNDANWQVKWNNSAYDPYDAEFHNLLRPDDEPINNRDLALVRNYKFTNGEPTDIGAEFTDKWESARAWRWMAIGPVKGKTAANVEEALRWLNGQEARRGFNSLNVTFSYSEYKKDSEAFFARMDALLALAESKGVTILATLLNDREAQGATNEELARYEAQVLRRHYTDTRIQAWDLYFHPGQQQQDATKLAELLRLLFRYARYEFPNQPVMATPLIKAKTFPAGFNYREAMLHGRRSGWNMVEFEGGANADICFLVWKMSDVISFSSNQSAPQTGWIKAIAYRYGRPIFCTQWQPTDEANARTTLDNFARSHVYWYQIGQTPLQPEPAAFRFIPIRTEKQ